MTMYAGQETDPGHYETQVHLLDSEIRAGADRKTLMSERFRRTIHKSLRPVDPDNPGNMNVVIKMEDLVTLQTMAANPFNYQAGVLLAKIYERAKEQGRVALATRTDECNPYGLDTTMHELRARGVDDPYGHIEDE